MTYGQHLKNVPQSQPLPGKEMVQNAAGGYVYEIDDWKRLRRFLILGNEGGTYYQSERDLTVENVKSLQACLKDDFKRAVDLIVQVSDQNLAPKNDPAIFALACATHFGPSPQAKEYAYRALPKVCRIGTHLFQFAQAREDIGGGWGTGMRKAVGRWYTDRSVPSLITQALKYRQRNGWSHQDLLRLSHPDVPDTSIHSVVFSAITTPEGGYQFAPTPGAKADSAKVVRNVTAGWKAIREFDLVEGYLQIQTAQSASEAAKIVADHKLPRELVPTQFLKDAAVWEALLPHMKLGALTRNLGNLSKCGLLTPLSEAAKAVTARFENEQEIRAERLHPWAILLAARTYAMGHGFKGDGAWTVVPQVVHALDGAFDLAFQNVEPTNKRFLLAIDVSGSMSWPVHGSPITACEAAAAMSMVTARREPNYYAMGFATEFRDLGITANDSLPTVMEKTRAHNMGGTDTTVAIAWALKNKVPVDVFVVYSDGETWAGNQHTSKALVEYRKKMGIPAKLAVVNFTSTKTSIVDPADAGSMDFVGFDASLPQALATFVLE